MDHQDKIPQETKHRLNQQCQSIVQELPLRLNPTKLYEAILKIRCNSMAIKSMKERPDESAKHMSVLQEETIGLALYLNAALLNHSCDPNCMTLFRGSQLIIKSKPGKKDQTEPTISYGPLASRMPLAERRNILLEKWHFLCTCHACVKEEQESTRNSEYRCSHCNGLFATTAQQCPKCQSVIDWKDIKQVFAVAVLIFE
jgi:hypothetical protein